MLNTFWYFFIFGFLGWCAEVIYAAGKTGKFVNRGFLNGPICPIYGVGVILVISLITPLKDNIVFLFLGSVLITSSLELIAGLFLKKIFRQQWWSYSDMPFNIGGYICLHYSLIWGVACLIVVDRFHPLIFSLVNWIPQLVSQISLIIFAGVFIVDLMSTVNSILKFNKNLKVIDEISLKIKETSDTLGENLASGAISLAQKKDDLEASIKIKKEVLEADIAMMKDEQQKALAHRKQALSDLHKANRELLEATAIGHKRMLKAFPRLKSIVHKDALEKIKKIIS